MAIDKHIEKQKFKASIPQGVPKGASGSNVYPMLANK